MKKILMILFLFSTVTFSQVDKGRIRLEFNGEKFDLPINSIVLRKENEIVISARAEKNDSTGQQLISMELPFKELDKANLGVGIKESELRFQILSRTKAYKIERRFNFNYGPKDVAVEFYYGKERVNWQYPSMQLKIEATKIDYNGKELKIVGGFSGKYKSNMPSESSKTIVEIKDGYFEIIL
ncbi:MAG: hypothetical protein FD143_114 [Ignavibacteria bacterium]|nr:MAG: hypothetical protein FD143_114 [Ignavibacteria bacterium]KAF0162472.1 MAG: hypothetical protein FD188_75 [Ignavibacteria bacterium]